MNFFPNLSSYIDDTESSKNIKYKSDVPSLPHVGYYPEKDTTGLPKISEHVENINAVCNPTTWVCKYSGLKIGSGETTFSTDEEIQTALKTAFPKVDLSFLDSMDNLLCQLPNIMIMLGYVESSTTAHTFYKNGDSETTPSNLVLTLIPNTSTSETPANNQTLFNACQTMMSQTRLYDTSELKKGGFYGVKDLFVKFPGLRPLLIGVLMITIYLLVQGTLSSLDMAFNISTIAASRHNPSLQFKIGLILGILIPFFLFVSLASKEIERTNSKYGTYDVSDSPHGVKMGAGSSSKDIGIMTMLAVTVFILVGGIYYIIRKRELSMTMKLPIVLILLIFLTVILFLLFYWVPILSFGNDNQDDRAYGISRPLRVYLASNNQNDISEVTSNKFIDIYLQRFIAIYAIVILAITVFYISRPNKPVMGWFGSIAEGIMVSCAILALPILWVFNWYVGIKFFMFYPMLLLIVRYLRYPMYYIARNMYLSNPLAQSANPRMKAEFEKPENYTAPWDLLGLTVFKTLMKMSGNRALYSEMFADRANGYQDISGNSYVTGHLFHMSMKSTHQPNEYLHHGLTAFISFIVFMFIAFGIVGKKNLS